MFAGIRFLGMGEIVIQKTGAFGITIFGDQHPDFLLKIENKEQPDAKIPETVKDGCCKAAR